MNKDERDINDTNDDGETILMLACREQNLQKVKHLIALGADVTLKNNSGMSALMIAAKTNNHHLQAYLIDRDYSFDCSHYLGV